MTRGVVSRVDHGFQYGRSTGTILQVSAALNPGNSGGPAVVDGRMVGLAFSRLSDAENIGYVIPNEEIDTFLEDAKDGRYDGKPVEAASTDFQRLENPSLRRRLRLDKGVQGVLVHPPRRPPKDYPLKDFDIITRIGDHAIDNEGMVRLGGEHRVPFLSLVPRLARDNAVPLAVLRGGRPVRVAFPVTYQDNRLVPEFQGETPDYFIHGPLVFAPAKSEAVSLYGRLNPLLYAGNSPLVARRFDRVRFPGEQLVVVTAPLFRHKIAQGYDDPVGKVVQSVNGVEVKNLGHLVELLRDGTDEFLTFRFADEWSEVLVFDRKEMDRVTAEVLEENGIAPSRRGSPDMLRAWNKRAALSR